jgi:multidrug efflux pump
MITAVALAVLFVPAFFVVVRAVFKKSKVKPHRGAALLHDTPPAPVQEGS